jgi:hypothetical protein
MAPRRVTVSLRESAEGDVYVDVLTREPLGPYKLLDRQWEPEQYLNEEVDPGRVQLTCVLEPDSGLWLPHLRASTPFWSETRFLDITAQSEERRLLEGMIGQEDFEILWANEGVRVRRSVHEGTREALEETFPDFPIWIGPPGRKRLQRPRGEAPRTGARGRDRGSRGDEPYDRPPASSFAILPSAPGRCRAKARHAWAASSCRVEDG